MKLINGDCLEINRIYNMDCLDGMRLINDDSIDCIITSPPYYGLRNYGVDGQLGLEPTVGEYVDKMVVVFHEAKRILKPEGTLFLNLGDSYGGSGMGLSYSGFTQGPNACDTRPLDMRPAIGHARGKMDKQLLGIPWRVAFALQDDGWILRSDIIWNKPNCMVESVKDRPTKSHEYVFMFAKNKKYYYDGEAIKEPATGYDGRKDTRFKGSRKYNGGEHDPNMQTNTLSRVGGERWTKQKYETDYAGNGSGMNNHSGYSNIKNPYVRNKRTVWTIPTQPFSGAHFAVFPEKLIHPMVLAGCPKGGVVFDMFFGAGTVGVVATKLGRNYIGIELKPEYCDIAEARINAHTKDRQLSLV